MVIIGIQMYVGIVIFNLVCVCCGLLFHLISFMFLYYPHNWLLILLLAHR